jgi:hypothetical protein
MEKEKHKTQQAAAMASFEEVRLSFCSNKQNPL